ncbi:RsmB/NOP family class I SAM-dependent RNA methyltransferase [Desulfonatronum sp. SC1]|uniref:RsmB/NOP family class I SAM-dependent RNA methyltransferase n=1 Tax=Desulfonatronum sp. SC1 TaxID=2109626 RepID=UPI000D314906|nr:RsmB/NOP family class I SAM-dependent RNA methyltransferase [Desulfonatronum sp. SC1]PTN33957.1 RNA methyltransferase [Desulfonatronum sp. SC1]
MPRSFRIVCQPEHVGLVEELLRAEGHVFTPEPFFPLAHRVEEEPTPLGASAAAAFGLIYIQDRSSMLAPLLLQPPQGGTVLDMCASPGSKTGLLAQLVGPAGMVLANEPNPRRLATLRQNLTALNLIQVTTCGRPGQELPLPEASFTHIQLDPPCSGWGTVERNPRVLEMWPEHKLGPLVALQRELLRRAAALLAPGGRLLYSTCTTNPAENREQVRWAEEHLGLTSVPLHPLPGFDLSHARSDALGEDDGCLYVHTEAGEGQGFFFAALTCSEARSNTPPATSEGVRQERSASLESVGRPHGGRGRKKDNSFGAVIRPGEFSGLEDAAWEHLPPGELRDFNGRVVFLPERALSQGLALPLSLGWRGFDMGRLTGGTLRLNPRLRLLLPEYRSGQGMSLDDVRDLRKLLQGQSLDLPSEAATGLSKRAGRSFGGRIGLYWRGLPLGWATVKGGRCLWSPK